MDRLDRALLAALQQDGRLTNAELAQRLGSSEATVRRRVQKLVDGETIKIVAVASPYALGYQVMAILAIRTDRDQVQSVSRALGGMDEVRFVGITLGAYDIVAEVWLEDVDAMLSFMSDRLAAVTGIQHVESIQVLKLTKYAYDWGQQPSAALPNPR